MWAMVGGWVRTLIVIVLLGNLVDLLLPKGDLRRYAGLIVGLVLLAIMLRPLVEVLNWANRGHQTSAFSWVTSGPSLTSAIAQEERHQAEALVETLPGVRWCQIQTVTANQVAATVAVAPSVSPKVLKAMVSQAVSLTLSSGTQLVALHIQKEPQQARAVKGGPV